MVRIALISAVAVGITFAQQARASSDADPNDVKQTIHARTLVGPGERVRVDSDTEYIYFRAVSDPPSWGMRNDWSIGWRPVETIREKPEWALMNVGVATNSSADNRVVLRVRTTEKDGVMEVRSEVLDAGRVAATYYHRVRKSYPPEKFDAYGVFAKDTTRPLLPSLTYGPSRRLVPGDFHPFNDFVKAAIGAAGVTPEGKFVAPVAETLPESGKLRVVSATFEIDRMVDAGEIPGNNYKCDRESDGHGFIAHASQGIFWKGPPQPEMPLPQSIVDGWHLESKTILCDPDGPRNEFWLAAYSEGHVHLWRYAVHFDQRALRVVDWLRADPPPDVRAKFDAMRPRRLQIASIGKREALLYLTTNEGRSGGRKLVGGYRIVMKVD